MASKKRAITMTNSEISAVLWIMGVLFAGFGIRSLVNLHNKLVPVNPGLAFDCILMVFLMLIGIFFFGFALFWINYLITKYDLNLFIDRITNPDFIGWLRFTKSKGFRSPIVRKKPLGYTEGEASGHKAGVVNNGDYTVTLPNGNQAIIKSDLLSININLEKNIGWHFYQKHFGFIGFNAWEQYLKDKADKKTAGKEWK
jgi:hypothetical protein